MKSLVFILPVICLLVYNASGQTAAADNKVSESVTFSTKPTGRAVYGIFEGRTPSLEVNQQLGGGLPLDHDHLKWQLILFQDSITLKPTTYQLITEMFNHRPLKGKWRIINGTQTNPKAATYVLETNLPGKAIYLLKGDNNVLFIQDENRDYRVGNHNFGYTLNRVQKVLRPAGN